MNTMNEKSKHVQGNASIMGNTPDNDGITHINIYSMGNTELGKLLSHFAHTPFTHPYFGPFYSMEGLWYYARCGWNEEIGGRLRYLSGFRAKRFGKELPIKKYDDFKNDIIAANYQKIIQNERIRELIVSTDLPFDHYYVFGPMHKVVTPKEADWLLEGFEDIRTALREGVVPTLWLDAERRYLSKK